MSAKHWLYADRCPDCGLTLGDKNWEMQGADRRNAAARGLPIR
jgi:hypothetical protein